MLYTKVSCIHTYKSVCMRTSVKLKETGKTGLVVSTWGTHSQGNKHGETEWRHHYIYMDIGFSLITLVRHEHTILYIDLHLTHARSTNTQARVAHIAKYICKCMQLPLWMISFA